MDHQGQSPDEVHQPDGSIYVPGKGLANYNTALSMMAMLASGDEIQSYIIKARQFLVRQQWVRR